MRKVNHLLRRQVHLWKFATPGWLILLAVMALVGAAGQAVGPVLAGAVTGSAGVVVSQTLRVSTIVVGSPADDFAATVNDEGTGFTIALETKMGQNEIIRLVLQNGSRKAANALMELSVPAALDVDAETQESDTCAQLSRTIWLCVIPNGGEVIDVVLEPKDDAAPGFYTITGRIVQISG